MKRFLWIILAVFLISGLVLSGCSSPSTPAPTTSAPTTSAPTSTTPAPTQVANDPIKLKFSYDMPKTGAIVPGWEWWATELEKRSNGRVKIEFYPGGALFKQPEAIDSLRAGVADLCNVSLQNYSQLFPVANVVTLPAVAFPDTDKAGYEAAYKAFMELYEKYPAIQDEYADFKIVFWSPMPAYRLVSKIKVEVPDDIKGKKIGGEGLAEEMIRLAGAASIHTIPPDSYMSMDKNVIDGTMVAWSHVSVYKLEEVASYFLNLGFVQNVTQILMTREKWESIPPDIQQMMTDLTPEALSRCTDGFLASNQKAIEAVNAKNRAIVTPTAEQIALWDAVTKPLEDSWIKDMESKGITNAADILADLKAKRAAALK